MNGHSEQNGGRKRIGAAAQILLRIGLAAVLLICLGLTGSVLQVPLRRSGAPTVSISQSFPGVREEAEVIMPQAQALPAPVEEAEASAPQVQALPTPVEEVDVSSPQAQAILEANELFRRVAASTENSAWIENGRVRVLGSDDDGQKNTSSWRSVDMVCLGDSHIVGLTEEGSLLFAGDNERGQLSLDTGGLSVRSIAAGPYATYAVLSDGTVRVSGASLVTDIELAQERNVLEIRASSSHVALLYADGTVKAFGSNLFGECLLDDWRDIVMVACGYGFTLGLDGDGSVHVAGDREKIPLDGLVDVKAIAAGANNGYALNHDWTLVAVGYNGGGQLNAQLWTDVRVMAGGYMHAVGLDGEGKLLTAGSDSKGQLSVD